MSASQADANPIYDRASHWRHWPPSERPHTCAAKANMLPVFFCWRLRKVLSLAEANRGLEQAFGTEESRHTAKSTPNIAPSETGRRNLKQSIRKTT